MADPVSVRIRTKPGDLGKVTARMAQAVPGALRAGLRTAARNGLSSLRARTVVARKVDTKALYRGWRARPADKSVLFYNVAKNHPYVEGGRRANSAMPPVAVIEAWAQRKIGKAGLGWAIAKKIAQRGIPPTPILTGAPTLEALRRITLRDVRAAWAAARRLAAR